MNKKRDKPTQKTKPKKGDPVEIPVPSKSQIEEDFEKIATSDSVKKPQSGDADSPDDGEG